MEKPPSHKMRNKVKRTGGLHWRQVRFNLFFKLSAHGRAQYHSRTVMTFLKQLNIDGINPWFFLTVAILSEVCGTTCMKLSNGFTRLAPTICMGVTYLLCFICLTIAVKKIDISISYAVWSGVGIAIISTIGVLVFHEPVTTQKIIGTLAIIAGVVMLYLK
jgi:small multidrug resistance pump